MSFWFVCQLREKPGFFLVEKAEEKAQQNGDILVDKNGLFVDKWKSS